MLCGVKDEFKKLKGKLNGIQYFLEDAEIKGFQDGAVRRWLDKLKDIVYDIEEIINDFSLRIDKSRTSNVHGSSSSFEKAKSFISQKMKVIYHLHKIGKRIQAINDRMGQIHKGRKQLTLITGSVLPPTTTIFQRPETTSGIIESEIFGIDKDAKHLVQLLTNKDGGDRVFAVVGMGGIGKTTLAQKIYNNGRIQSHFQKRIWVCVSKYVHEIDVLKEIITQAGGQCGEDRSKEALTSKMKSVLSGKRFLLVLDDLWSDQVWKDCLRVPLHDSTSDSMVLITTRNGEIATQMGAAYTHEMGVLSDDDAWSVLCKVANQGGNARNIDQSMEEVGMKIVKKCKGLPLAIKVIGGVLMGKGIAPELQLSYIDLPPYLKPCFLYCSLFPEDYEISQTELTRMWIAEGFVKEDGDSSMEDRAEMYHQELVARSLLQVVYYDPLEMVCKMHDLVREMAISLTEGFHSPQQDSEGASLKPRRLSISTAEQFKELKEMPLRSLLFFGDIEIRISIDLSQIFVKLKYIRVLNLSHISIDRLPDAIGKLAQLRYLDISHTRITELPDSLCNLEYLQTLLLQKCPKFTKLPTDFRRLQALRHLIIENVMPAGIRQLTHLQTLKTFKIHNNHHNDGGEGPHDDDGCNINELGLLSQLRYLVIEDLQNVRSGAEAKKAAMQDKTHLRNLRLVWNTWESPPDERAMMRLEEVFEELCPPSSIQVLLVNGFPGRELPRRMTSLQNLIHLVMNHVHYLQQLPSLGLLPQLKQLYINFNDAIKIIGSEFMFGGGGRRGGGGAFPKLEVLEFTEMNGWEEWRDGMEQPILPRLTSLKLFECPKLRSLPMSLLRHATNLTHLQLYKVGVEDIGGLVHVRELKLLFCDNLESLWKLPALESLKVQYCPSLEDTTNLGVASLTHINLDYFEDDCLPGNNIEALKGVNVTDETRLVIEGSIELIRKCIPELNGPYWPTIQRFPQVHATTYTGDYFFSYTKSTSEFKNNLPPLEVNAE
ncbi:putative disease resistance RPP13-like protein 1 [Acorus gramineus]|uniref:Disease resistance RPP13-like protein 1 n=1 Tax=Acorus gramineus TaxID=55184 RepID=A0AAV9B492_ACOGR|nr:putative disease resistance RPP13-like protein 1 [Acorus gramineus]